MIIGFIDTMRAEGHSVESICRVLREQGCQVAARTYRAWRAAGGRVAQRTLSDAIVQDSVRAAAWTTDVQGARVLAPEGLHGPRKMTGHLRRTHVPDASRGAVDRGDAGTGPDWGAPRQASARHDPGQGRHPCRGPAEPAVHRACPERGLGHRPHVCPHPGRVGLRRIHRGHLRPEARVMARRGVQGHRARHDPAADRVVAARPRGAPRGARRTHPSQRCGQYTSVHLTEHLALEGIRTSIGSVGDAYDNGLMESINGLYKAECIRTTEFHAGPYRTIGNVEFATAGWVEWYNNRRLHSSLGNVPPAKYEHDHHAALNREPQPA